MYNSYVNITYHVQISYWCNEIAIQHKHFAVYMLILCILYKLVSEIVINRKMLLDKEKKESETYN